MQNLDKLTELATKLPDNIRDNAIALVKRMGEVIEGFGDKPLEWRPEMLKLVQGTSDRGKLPKGANIGSFVLGEDILEQPYRVIPLRITTSRQYWNPDPDQAQMLCNSPDGIAGFQYGQCNVCPYKDFDKEANKSQCNKTLSIMCLSESFDRIFTVNFSKTNYMSGIDWQGIMKKAGVAPYKRVYTVSSQTSTKSKNVELIKAEVLNTGNRVEGATLAFVEELFRISGEDRKESLIKFHEYVSKKAANPMIAGGPPEDVLLITGEDTGKTTVEVVAATEVVAGTTENTVKDGTKKYKF